MLWITPRSLILTKNEGFSLCWVTMGGNFLFCFVKIRTKVYKRVARVKHRDKNSSIHITVIDYKTLSKGQGEAPIRARTQLPHLSLSLRAHTTLDFFLLISCTHSEIFAHTSMAKIPWIFIALNGAFYTLLLLIRGKNSRTTNYLYEQMHKHSHKCVEAHTPTHLCEYLCICVV